MRLFAKRGQISGIFQNICSFPKISRISEQNKRLSNKLIRKTMVKVKMHPLSPPFQLLVTKKGNRVLAHVKKNYTEES